jgi:hypothetical protein
MEIDLTGNVPSAVADIIDRLKSIKDLISEAAQNSATRIQSEAKNRTPVRTGVLRSGWKVTASDNEISAINDTDYAVYVQDGTSKMSARQMMDTDRTSAVASEELEKTFDKAFR